MLSQIRHLIYRIKIFDKNLVKNVMDLYIVHDPRKDKLQGEP